MAWFADPLESTGPGQWTPLQINAPDPWNFDLEQNLPVEIEVTGPTTCKILKRRRNNKRYVQIPKS